MEENIKPVALVNFLATTLASFSVLPAAAPKLLNLQKLLLLMFLLTGTEKFIMQCNY